VTPSHLDRLLKRQTGLTYLQHLRGIRMRHAERLLLTTTSSIKETAYACGYAGTGSFGRDFKRTHGCAARVWRAMGRIAGGVRDLKRADRRMRGSAFS
jgi:two-component system, response regulator YesN